MMDFIEIKKIIENPNLSKNLKTYYLALGRLLSNSHSKINLDTVAIEAGRKRGAIKGNSPEIRELKAIIKKISGRKYKDGSVSNQICIQQKSAENKIDLDALLQQLASLVIENMNLKVEIKLLKEQVNSSNNIIYFNKD